MISSNPKLGFEELLTLDAYTGGPQNLDKSLLAKIIFDTFL